jgi:hypothetical protein
MKFRFYDILSHLIPGFIIYITYLEFKEEAFDKDFVVPATAIAFVLGYFVNTLASWFEDFYYWTWGGKPSDRLLDGRDIWKVRFYEHEKTKELLSNESTGPKTKNDALFSIAMRYATPEINSRVGDFNANYAFSRVILTTILIASGFMIYMHYDSYSVYMITIPLIFISWYRSKQRGYYYAREVLKTYLQAKTTSK